MNITDKITLTCEDNMEMMSRYPVGYFDVAIIDPEYGIGESKKNHKSRNTPVKQKNGLSLKCPTPTYHNSDWDNKPAGREYFLKLERVSRKQIIFGANYFEHIMAVQKPPRREQFDQFIEDHPYHFIIWDKVNGSNDFNDCEVIYVSEPIKSYVLKYMWAGMMQGKSIAEGEIVQGNKKLNEKRIHPTQKPVIIYKYLFNEFCQEGDVILDTHHGSGSISIAAHDYGFKIVACEKDKTHFSDSVSRIKKHINQTNLFLS